MRKKRPKSLVKPRQSVTLTFNDSGRFEDRWVYLKTNKFSHCIFTKNMDKIYLPARHGEGKLVVDSMETLEHLKSGRGRGWVKNI